MKSDERKMRARHGCANFDHCGEGAEILTEECQGCRKRLLVLHSQKYYLDEGTTYEEDIIKRDDGA